MKLIKYKVLCYTPYVNEAGEEVQLEDFAEVSADYCEEALEVAKQTAYNGEYTIEDDGIEEKVQPTIEERTAALEAAVMMLCMPDASEV